MLTSRAYVRLCLALFVLLCAGSMSSQSTHYPGAPGRTGTVSSLPPPSTSTGHVLFVIDGATSGDCTSGGGTLVVACKSNGSGWIAQTLGSGTVSGASTPNTTSPLCGNGATNSVKACASGTDFQPPIANNTYDAFGAATAAQNTAEAYTNNLLNEVNALSLGIDNQATNNAQPAIATAISQNKSLYFPDGTYKIDLHTGAWGINNYTGSIRFAANAKWIITPPTNHGTQVIVITNGNNVLISGMHITFSSDPTGCIIAPDIQCAATLTISNGSNITIDNFTEDEAQSAGILVGGTTNLTLHNVSLTNQGGTIFAGVKNLQITDFACYNTADDCINVASAFATTGAYGATIHGLTVVGSGARCALISSPNTILDGFTCLGAEDAGIGVEYSSCCTQNYTPDGVVISNGFVADVRNNGTATNPTYPKACVYLDSDLPNLGNVSISNLICERPDGEGIRLDTTGGALKNLSIENVQVFNAGNSVGGALDGACFYLSAVSNFQGNNNSCQNALGPAYFIVGDNTGTVTITGGNFYDVNTTQGSNRVIDIEDFKHFNVGDMTIVDDRNPSDSYILAENNTPSGGSGTFHNIQFTSITAPQIFSGTGRVYFSDISPGVGLAGLGSTYLPGSHTYCSDCDTPSSQGATCTNSGDHAGAVLQLTRGVKRCY